MGKAKRNLQGEIMDKDHLDLDLWKGFERG
jgi:hypothetical protein